MSYIGGMYTGLKYIGAPVNNATQIKALDDFLEAMVDANKQNSVVSIFMIPTSFVTTTSTNPVRINKTVVRNTNINGYEPKNNKLFTYPFNFVSVDTLNGQKNYRYEFSQNKSMLSFAMICAMSANPEIMVAPYGYNGTEGETFSDSTINATEAVYCNGFPQCAFSIDAFRAYLAQKASADAIGLVGQVGSIAIGGVSASTALGAITPDLSANEVNSLYHTANSNIASGALGTVGLASSINSMVIEATRGDRAMGTQGTSTAVGARAKGVYFKQMSVTAEYARMIDDYFQRFGYACCKVKVPNRNVRPHWCYVKTNDVNITGSIPTNHMRKIKSIYNSGITFWKHGNEVGNYSLDNSV